MHPTTPIGSFSTSASWVASIGRVARPAKFRPHLRVIVECGGRPADLVGFSTSGLPPSSVIARASSSVRLRSRGAPRAASRPARPAGWGPPPRRRRAAASAASTWSSRGRATVASVSSLYGFSTSRGPPAFLRPARRRYGVASRSRSHRVVHHHVLGLRCSPRARKSTGPCRTRTARSPRAASRTRAGCGRSPTPFRT